MKQNGEHFCRLYPVFLIISPSGNYTRQIMVVPKQTVPATIVQAFLPVGKHLLKLLEWKRRQIPFFLAFLLVQSNMLKLEYHGKLTAIRIAVELCPVKVCSPGFSYSNQISLLEGLFAQFTEILVQSWSVYGDFLIRLLGNLVDYIKPEAANSLIHPPENHIVDFPANLWIFPV